MSETASNDFWHNMPESKLELIGGRLIAGNSLAGSRYLLWAILRTLGPRAALPLAPSELWWQVLANTFQAPALLSSPRAWQAWADKVEHTPRVEPDGAHFDWRHHDAYSDLMMGLYAATHEDAGIGRSIQRFVMRLGDHGFMPDLQLVRCDRLHLFQTYYVDGPADLVVEVVLPGHAAQDAEVKRRLYADGGVHEYWIVDPAVRTFDVLRLADDGYIPQVSDAEGRYRSARIPGLVCEPAKLWACLDSPEEHRRSLTSGAVWLDPSVSIIESRTKPNDADVWQWDRPPFAPPIGLRRTPISFDQYISWCPEAKFELIDGKPYIGGWQGTRDVLGLLLMTFGLEEAVTLLHPRDWVAGLLAEEEARLHDAGRRDAWWTIARQAAEFLRERLGPLQLAVIGDLVWPAPLHFWSQITLVAWELPRPDHMFYGEFYRRFPEPEIELLEAEQASSAQQRAIEHEAIPL